MNEKTIFYGVAGEGLGHASRVLAIVEHMPDVNFHIFTFGDALEFLGKNQQPNVTLHEIAGLRFGRVKDKINNWVTIKNFLAFIPKVKKELDRLEKFGKLMSPNLIIADFEPILSRLAWRLQINSVSIDNQHKFSRCNTSALPFGLRLYTFFSGLFIERFVYKPTHAVIANFCRLYLDLDNKNYNKTTMAPCLIRKHLTEQEVRDDGFLLLYWKKSLGFEIIQMLKELEFPVKVYGKFNIVDYDKFKVVPDGKVEFNQLDYVNFVKDMAHCTGVIGGAGNQLLGECIYYGKPVLTIPEGNQQEQAVNAFYTQKYGTGVFYKKDDINIDVIKDFLVFAKSYKKERVENGVHKTIEIIRNHL